MVKMNICCKKLLLRIMHANCIMRHFISCKKSQSHIHSYYLFLLKYPINLPDFNTIFHQQKCKNTIIPINIVLLQINNRRVINETKIPI